MHIRFRGRDSTIASSTPASLRRELVHRRAELAGDDDLAVLDHVGAVVRREAFQHRRHRIARAGAARLQRQRLEHAHAALVEQAIEQPLAGEIGIDQFDVLDGRDQRLALDPGVVLGDRVRHVAFGRIARMQIGLPRALRRLRQKLHENAAGAPAMLAALAAAKLLADRNPHPRRNLLRAQEIFVGGCLPAHRRRARPGPDSGSCPAPDRWSWRDDPCRAGCLKSFASFSRALS